MARVAMKAGIGSRVMMTPFTKPVKIATANPSSRAGQNPMNGSMPFNIICACCSEPAPPIITAEKIRRETTERSMPPAITTSACPMASTPTVEVW